MKYLRLFISIFFGMLMITLSSASITSYAEWSDMSNSFIIEEGQSASFEVHLTANPSFNSASIRFYDDSYNQLHEFYSGTPTENFYSPVLTVDQSIYSTIGSYEIEIIGEDIYGNIDSISLYLTVNPVTPLPDTTAPIITLLGDNPQVIQLGDAYTELGATATDNVDGDLTNQIVIDSSLVNTNAVGLYIVQYSVSDSSSNSATEFRTVNVTDSLSPVDNIAPIITLLGDNPQYIALNNPYIELGATATDDIDGNITDQIVINISTVNTSQEGIYTVTYNVNDSSNNQAIEVTRTVNVTSSPIPDNTAPIITVISPEDDEIYKTKEILFKVELNENATVFYNLNGGNNITMYETSSLIFEHGRILDYDNYTVTFYAIDEAGNLAEEIIDFSIEKSSSPRSRSSSRREEENETIIDYFEAGVKDNTAQEISFDNGSTLKLGYVVLSLLSMGIIVLVFLIILIVKTKEEEKKELSKEYAEIFKDDDFN